MAKKKKKKVDAPLSEKEKRKQKIQEYNDKVAKMNGEKTSKEKAKEKKENNILSAFDDGYNFGDVTRTINKAFEKGVDKAYEMADEFKKDKNKTSEKVKYLGEGLKTGTVNAATNFVDAPLQNIQEGAQKSKNKSGLRNYGEATLKNLDPTGLSTFLDPQNVSEVYQLWTDSKKSVTDKILGTGMKILNNNPLTRGLEATGQSANTFRDAEEDVKNIRKAIRKPSEKLNKEYEKKGQKFTQGMREIGEASQNIGQQVPTAALSILTKNPDIGLYAMGTSAKGGSTYEAEQRGADLSTANDIGLAKGLTEIGTEKISSLGSKWYGQGKGDDLLESVIDNKVKGKVANYLTKKAAGVGGEILEEGISDVVDTAIDKATVDPDAKYTVKDFLHTAKITALSTIGMNAVTGNYSKKAYQKNALEMAESQRSENAQKVFEKELSDRLMEESDNGKNKLKGKDIIKITQEVAEDVANGQIDVSKIESTLGGDTYKQYQDLQNKKSSLLKEQETLRNKSMNEATLGDSERLKQIESEISGLDDTELKERLSNEVRELTKDDNLLAKSYEEKDNRSKEFIYEGTDKDTDITKATIESTKGKLNNTKKAHNLVDALIKMGNDKGVTYKVTNNEELKKMGLVQEGQTTNGVYIGKNGEIYVNLDSKNYLEQIIMHETTHVLEKAKAYKDLQNLAFEFAKKNGTYETLEKEIQKNYDNKDWDSELTARIVEDNLGNEDFVTELTHQKPAIVQKIIDTIKYLKKQFTAGSSEARKLNKIQYQLEQAYKKAYNEKSDTNTNKNFSEQKSTSFSLTKDSNGKELTKEQQEYFKDSKVRDKNGNLIIMNHATNDNSFTIFDENKQGTNSSNFKQKGELGRGFYFSDEQTAYTTWNDYVERQTGKPVKGMSVYLKINNPFYYSTSELNKDVKNYLKDKDVIMSRIKSNADIIKFANFTGLDIQNMLKELGYDGIIEKDDNNIYQAVVFNSNQIKNIDNLTPTQDDDIRYSKEETGAIENLNNIKGYKVQEDTYPYDNVIGHSFDLKTKDGTAHLQIRETADKVYLNMINTRLGNSTVEKGAGTKILNNLKEYSDKTGKQLVIAGEVPSASKFYDKFEWLTKEKGEIIDDDGNLFDISSNNRIYNPKSTNKYSNNKELDNSSFNLDKNAKRYDDLSKAKYILYFTKDNGDVRINIMDSNNNLINQMDLYNQREAIKELGEDLGKQLYQSSSVDEQRFNIGNDINNLGNENDYFMTHRPTETGITADDLTKQGYEVGLPSDIYEHPEYYSMNDKEILKETMDQLNKVRNNPDADITIYRATTGDKINKGDWITLSKKYAEMHNESQLDGKGNVVEKVVKAKDIQHAGDVIEEWGYFPKENVITKKDSQGKELSKQQQEYFKDSKVRDSEGRLLEVYHGTPNGGFTIFDRNKTSRAEIKSQFGTGFYFTNNSRAASDYNFDEDIYGNTTSSPNAKTYKVYLDIENPLVIEARNANEHNLDRAKIKELLLRGDNDYFFDEYIPFITNTPNELNYQVDGLNKEQIKSLSKEEKVDYWLRGTYDLQNFGDKSFLQSMYRAYKNNSDLLDNFKDIFGYDGIIVNSYNGRTNQYIAFEPNQIKNVDNLNPTEDPDIRYSKTVEEANTTQDNKGRKLSKEIIEHNKNSVLIDNDGNLITAYHTTTNDVAQFNEFNPVGTDYYKFGDQVVNYYTNDKNMSGSYANQDYVMADTSKITDKKGVNDILVETNNKLNGDRIFVIETNANGTYFLYDKLHKNNHLMTKLYESQDELFKNIKQDLQERAGFREKIQYEGYVNITNPYIVDAEKRNWNQVVSESNEFIDDLDERVPDDIKNNLTRLYRESENKSAEARENYNVLENIINQGIDGYNSSVDEDVRKVNKIIKKVGYDEIEDLLNYDGQMGIMGVRGWYNLSDALKEQDLIGDSTAKLIIDDFKLPENLKEYIKENYTKEIPLHYIQFNDMDITKAMNQLGKSTTLKDIYNKNQENYNEFDKYRMPNSYFLEELKKEGNDYLGYDLEDMFETRAEVMGADTVADEISQAASVGFSKPELIRLWGTSKTTNDIVKEVIASNKDGKTNYDGVIIRNVYDYGGKSAGEKTFNDLYVTFNSNQFKAVDNTNPTDDPDIRYSKGNNIAPVKKKGTLGSEVKLENGKVNLDNIAPVKGEVKYSAKEDKNSAKKTIKPSRKARKSYVSEKVEKAIINQAYKNMNVTTKTAQNYLQFTSEQKKEFKNSLIDLTTKMKDELTNAKTYNKVKDIVSNYANVEYNYVDEELKSIKKEIRGTKIKVPDEVKAQITDYSDFRKASRLNINSQGQSIDSVYQELSQEYPYLFSEDVQTEADMLYELSDFMYKDEKTTEKYRIPDNELKRATDKIYNSILNNSLTQAEIEEMQRDLDAKAERRTRQVVQHELLNKMGISIEDIDTGKDVSSAKVQLLDPKRLNEDVFSKEAAQKINDATVNFVNEQEAKNNRWKKKERQEIKDLGIKARSKESAAVQKYGEKEYVNDKGELVKYGDAELEREFSNPKTREKIKNAAKVLRDKYDNYIDKINESLTQMGYDPIPKRKDYFRHFYEINDKLSEWGIPFNRDSMNSDTLPTDINGLTDQFKPGKNFFASALQRTGKKTTYDAITGIDGYLESAGNLIHHTESIQRYRTLSKFIRDNYGSQHGMENLDGLTDEQIEKRISDIQNNKLSKYVAWLDEQANALAGKKGAIDRSMERFFGRRVYSALNTLKSQVGSNMTGFNVRSAMTNFASAVQGASKTNKLAFLKGTISTLNNIVHDDGLIDKSNFLTNRFGSDTLSKKAWQKVANAGQIFMTGSDYFTANQIWRSKYYENLSKGMNENQAIKNADDFASRIMGDRSKGQTAEIFNSKTLGFLTQFQLEVNNQWNSILHDNKIDLKNKNKSGAMVTFQLGQLFAASYMFNNLMKSLTGSDVMFDPIDILKGIFKPDDKDKDKTLEERSRDALGKLVNQLPMASIFTGGRIPLSEAFKGVSTGFKYATNQKNEYGQKYSLEDVKDDMIGSAAYWLLPTGYGQIKKTVKGLSMFDDKLPVKGSYTKSGNLRFSVDDTASERVKASLFGQYATKHAQDYIDSEFESINKSKLDEMKDLKMNSTDYKKLKKGINESGTSSEDKLNYIKDLDISNKKKNILASGVMKKDIDMKEYSKYDSLNEYKYAKENPSKYQTIRAITTYNNYKQIQKDLSEIKADVDRNGKTISNSRFKKVVNYVNSLKLTAVQKAMLIKQEYPSFKQYDNKIAQYINKQNYDFRQKATILKGLGFSNYDKQIINYVKEHYQSTDEQVQVLKDMGFKTYEYNGKIYIKR